MELVSVKVRNFRNIKNAKVDIADLTCLVGPNNEGKSNLLRALSLGLSTLLGEPTSSGTRYISEAWGDSTVQFNPRTDLPYGANKRVRTEIELEFKFTDPETADLCHRVGHNLNDRLPVVMSFNRSGEGSIRVAKQRVAGELTAKVDIIRKFFTEYLRFYYMPAARTVEDANQVIKRLVSARLSVLEDDVEYSGAMRLIRAKQQAALKSVEGELCAELAAFIPEISAVNLEFDDMGGGDPYLSSFTPRLEVNDGVPTPLAMKGSGVQSLVTFALLRMNAKVASERVSAPSIILAWEEPEAHLHGGALHKLRPLLSAIAEENQLIFTTHSSILVSTRSKVAIVSNKQVRTSNSIASAREALGVSVGDNLRSASLVILVEGKYDEKFWTQVMADSCEELGRLLDSGQIVIDAERGSGRLREKLTSLRYLMCEVFVIHDSDDAGSREIRLAIGEHLMGEKNYHVLQVDHLAAAELEDLLDESWLNNVLTSHFGVDMKLPKAKSPFKARLQEALKDAGKITRLESRSKDGKSLIEGVKETIWREFFKLPDYTSALSEAGIRNIDRIIGSIAKLLGVTCGCEHHN